MIENNSQNPIQEPEEDTFERLLDEFIRSQEEETDGTPTADAAPACQPCRHGGHTYLVPAANGAEPLHFHGFSLGWNRQELSGQTAVTDRRLYLTRTVGCPALHLRLDSIHCQGEDRPFTGVRVLLYREGESEPVGDVTEEAYDAILTFRFDLSVLPGRYFFLLADLVPDEEPERYEPMGGHTRLDFSVVKHGELLQHPAIQTVMAMREPMPAEDGPACTSGNLRLVIPHRKGFGSGDEYRATCYTRQLIPMGSTPLAVPAAGCEGHVEGTVRSGLIWLDGDYTVVLTHNRQPFYAFGFTLRQGVVVSCGGYTLQPYEVEYQAELLSFVAGHAWERIRELPGTGRSKRRLLEQRRRNTLNRMRAASGMDPIGYNAHYWVTGPDLCQRKDLAWDVTSLLEVNQRGAAVQIDARQLVAGKAEEEVCSDLLLELADCGEKTVVLTGLDVLVNHAYGRMMRTLLTGKLRNGAEEWSLILVGTPAETSALQEAAPELAAFFPEENRLEVEGAAPDEAVWTIQQSLAREKLVLSHPAEARLAAFFCGTPAGSLPDGWDRRRADDFVRRGILPRFQQRILQGGNAQPDKELLTTVCDGDIDFTVIDRTPEDGFAQCMAGLDAMVGLEAIKRSLGDIFLKSRFDRLRSRLGLPAEEDNRHHMLFCGNPGTGKTTVAEMMGRIFRSLGILSKGEVVTADRGSIVGRYIGETEQNMQALLEKARGNVLFIDEAYTLCTDTDDRKDYGHRAIECLLPVLARKNPDMVVIMAGYEQGMQRMMQANQGLEGRFQHRLHFADYTADELMQMARNLLERKAYRLTAEAGQALRRLVEETLLHKDARFSNARWMEQLIERRLLPAMARRVLALPESGRPELYRDIEAADVEQAALPDEAAETPRRRIGFRP